MRTLRPGRPVLRGADLLRAGTVRRLVVNVTVIVLNVLALPHCAVGHVKQSTRKQRKADHKNVNYDPINSTGS